MPVVLALDYGRKRIGVALSDPGESFVFPRPTLHRKDAATDLEALRRLCEEEEVETLVVGLPLNDDGTEGEMAREVRRYGGEIGQALGRPVIFVDERYSSQEADERLRERYRDPRKRKALRDQGAAAIILRTYLDDPDAFAE